MTTSPIVQVTDDLIADLDDMAHCGPEELTISAWTLAALLAERAELKRDAERYRGVRRIAEKQGFTEEEFDCQTDARIIRFAAMQS